MFDSAITLVNTLNFTNQSICQISHVNMNDLDIKKLRLFPGEYLILVVFKLVVRFVVTHREGLELMTEFDSCCDVMWYELIHSKKKKIQCQDFKQHIKLFV